MHVKFFVADLTRWQSLLSPMFTRVPFFVFYLIEVGKRKTRQCKHAFFVVVVYVFVVHKRFLCRPQKCAHVASGLLDLLSR